MIEKLKFLESNALPGPWFAYADEGVQVLEQKDADFVCALRNLAPELIALWEAAQHMALFINDLPYDTHGARQVVDALEALNAKAKEGL